MSLSLYKYSMGGSQPDNSWLASNWDAGGQGAATTWKEECVVQKVDGSVDIILQAKPEGAAGRPYWCGEIQGNLGTKAHNGRWQWLAKAPEMVPGAIFGMFLYQADWRDPWIEYDFEFVGADTTRVQINVHMRGADGVYRSASRWISLGFDAAKVHALYEIEVLTDRVEAYVNGALVATLSGSDLGGRFDQGELVSYVDLWPIDNSPDMINWAGRFEYPGKPLVANIKDANLNGHIAAPGTPTPADPSTGIGDPPPEPDAPTPIPNAPTPDTFQVTGTLGPFPVNLTITRR